MMVQCMKTILSFYEKKKDRILSDYNYMICMPLIVAFCELRYMLNSPAELIGMYFKLMEIIQIYDPLTDRKLEQDGKYELDLINKSLKHLKEVDIDLFEKIQDFMVNERNAKSFALIIRKFVQSLSFFYLNVDTTLYVWDQILLKVEPEDGDMYYAFAAMLMCCKDELMLINNWSEFAEMIYLKAKTVSLDEFSSKYSGFVNQ